MKTSSEGFQQCYNAQMAVDGEHQIIVATQVGPQASDQGQTGGDARRDQRDVWGRACGGTPDGGPGLNEGAVPLQSRSKRAKEGRSIPVVRDPER